VTKASRQPLRLGLVSFAWTNQHNGGLRSHVRDMAHKLSERGTQIHVFCVNTDPSATPFETSGWSEGDIHVQAMNYSYHDLRTFYDFQHVPHAGVVLSDWAERLQLQLIDIHHNLFIGMGVIPTLSAIAPTLVTLHDYWPLDPRGQLFSPDGQPHQRLSREQWEAGARLTWPTVFERSLASSHYFNGHTTQDLPDLQQSWVNYSQKMLSACRLLIAPSKTCARIYREHGTKQAIKIVENGIDTSKINNLIKRESTTTATNNPKIRLGLLGNSAPSKGQLTFCKACLKNELGEYLDLHLYGDIPQTYHGDPTPQNELLRLCQQHPETIHTHGAYEREDLSRIFESCDLVVMPSLWQEVYGLIAREALCYGLPLIVSDAGGLQELSKHSHVLVLNHLRPTEWGEQLRQWILEGPLMKWVYERRLRIPPPGNNVRSSDDCAHELLSIYRHLIQDS
jgi:glycosyltransferase involved in cell wall biosynthesis